MPKGTVNLPDGRTVGSRSNELKAYLLENPDFQVTRSSRHKDSDIEAEGEGFTLPPPPIGVPKQKLEKPSPAAAKEKTKADEVEDYKQLVGAVFSGVAALAGSQVYLYSEQECEAIAKPLARIVGRNTGLKKAVQQVADPVALFAAIAFPLGIKIAVHQEELKVMRLRNVTRNLVTDVNRGPQASEVPNNTEVVNVPQAPPTIYDNTLSRISQGG